MEMEVPFRMDNDGEEEEEDDDDEDENDHEDEDDYKKLNICYTTFVNWLKFEFTSKQIIKWLIHIPSVTLITCLVSPQLQFS